MKGFLEELSELIYHTYQDNLQELMVVFPNRRAGLFFQKYLTQYIDTPVWSPEIISIEEFVKKLTPLQIADRLSLVFTLFEVFKQHSPYQESFDRFYFWGELLLNDFDEIDKYLIDTEDLFSNIKDLREIEDTYAYLTEEQQEAIAKFWKSFEYTHLGEQAAQDSAQQKFIRLWGILYPVYEAFKAKLTDLGMAYEGMLFRKIVEELDHTYAEAPHQILPGQKVIFAGFNALSAAEEKIITWFLTRRKAEIHWDFDKFYVDNPHHEAGLFFRKYAKKQTFAESLKTPHADHFHTGEKREVTIQGVTLEVGQAKKLGEVLDTLSQNPDFNPEKTVIVLPEEHLLFSVLHALPEAVKKINVTMGYPLRNTPLYSFLEHLLNMQQNTKDQNGKVSFHFRTVLAVLRHPYVVYFDPKRATENVRKIETENKIFIAPEELTMDTVFYPQLFRFITSTEAMFDYLLNVLKQINEHYEAIKPAPVRDDTSQLDLFDQGEEEIQQPWLEQEYIYHFFTHLSRLQSIVEQEGIRMSVPTFLRLFRQVMQSLRLPFTGEPLNGLQVMGVLETRNLDFENVVILSMNEGSFPTQNISHSFIPHNLRFGFGLPSFDHQDAIASYLFFRLIQRARRVFLFYNTEDTPYVSGEMSRFLYQLIYEATFNKAGELIFPAKNGDFRIHRQTLSSPVQTITPAPITIHKDEQVMQQLDEFIVQNGEVVRRLTPSALNTYLDCRLRFYYQYVAKIEQSDEVKEEVDPLIFGNILHKTMEIIYTRFIREKGKDIVAPEDCALLKEQYLNQAIEQGFTEHFTSESATFHFEGRNVIVREVVKKMAEKILSMDEQYAPFSIVGLEQKGSEGYTLNLEIEVNHKKIEVGLRGIIDRIDKKDEVVRVLDYKTGKDERQIYSIASLFDREDAYRNKAAMQALFYALLYYEKYPEGKEKIVPGLLNAKELFTDSFDVRLRFDKEPVADFAFYVAEYRQQLKATLTEIFDPTIPFNQTQDIHKCKNCPYFTICW